MSKEQRRGPLEAALAAALVAGVLLVGLALAAAAQANTYTPNKLGDHAPGACTPADCTLREAVIKANHHAGTDTIVLQGGKVYKRSSTPGTDENHAQDGDLDITDPVVIRSSNRRKAIVDGNFNEEVFQTFASATFVRLVVRNGNSGSTGDDGGGISGQAGTLTLRRSGVRHCSSAPLVGGGGGIAVEPGSSLVLSRGVVSDNHSGTDDGAGIYAKGPARITKSTVSGNGTGGDGGGVYVDLGPTDPPVRIIRSTISGNQAGDGGGGILVDHGRLALTNSTIAANDAGELGGGIWNEHGQVTANAITVARNVAGGLGGGLLYAPAAPGFDVENSLIALNRAGGNPNDCEGDAFDSLGHNLLSTHGPGGNCQGFDRPSDRLSHHPRIGKLADNGGPTKTIALRSGSPAIDNASRHTSPKRDQRGVLRDDHPDIGAFERR